MQRHTMTEIVNHSRSAALERSVKYYWGFKPILRDHNPGVLTCSVLLLVIFI